MTKAIFKKWTKLSVPLFLLFLGIFLAFLFEEKFRHFVRYIVTLTNGNKIQFFGKNFHLFPSTKFVFSFGWFLTLTYITLNAINKNRLRKLFITGLIFLVCLTMVVVFDSKRLILECTNCIDGLRKVNYNQLSYDSYFIISLTVAYIFILISFFIDLKQKKDE